MENKAENRWSYCCGFCQKGWNGGIFFFPETGFLCVAPDCSGTHSVDQAGLELRNPSASASQVLGLKACATTTRLEDALHLYYLLLALVLNTCSIHSATQNQMYSCGRLVRVQKSFYVWYMCISLCVVDKSLLLIF